MQVLVGHYLAITIDYYIIDLLFSFHSFFAFLLSFTLLFLAPFSRFFRTSLLEATAWTEI